jgi:hypothetical protein
MELALCYQYFTRKILMSKNLETDFRLFLPLALLRPQRMVAASTMIADREWQAQGQMSQ